MILSPESPPAPPRLTWRSYASGHVEDFRGQIVQKFKKMLRNACVKTHELV